MLTVNYTGDQRCLWKQLKGRAVLAKFTVILVLENERIFGYFSGQRLEIHPMCLIVGTEPV